MGYQKKSNRQHLFSVQPVRNTGYLYQRNTAYIYTGSLCVTTYYILAYGHSSLVRNNCLNLGFVSICETESTLDQNTGT